MYLYRKSLKKCKVIIKNVYRQQVTYIFIGNIIKRNPKENDTKIINHGANPRSLKSMIPLINLEEQEIARELV